MTTHYYGNEYCVGDTTETGAYPEGVSIYGAYDMAGNVLEWIGDYSGLRGGSWRSVDKFVRTTKRLSIESNKSTDIYGFRCVR